MGNRLSKIYTRKGDSGTTGLSNGSRIGKHTLRVQCMGEVDELNSIVGVIRCHSDDPVLSEYLLKIQHQLFDLGGELSLPGHTLIGGSHISYVESLLDILNSELEPLKDFILPGGIPAAAYMHVARTVCRRAERSLFALQEEEKKNDNPLSEFILQYINRLSDLFFVMARYANKQKGNPDILWDSEVNQLPE